MTAKRRAMWGAIAVAVFAAGVCAGRQAGPRTSVDQFLEQSGGTQLDRTFTFLQMQEINNSISVLEEREAPAEPGIPSYHFNDRTHQIQVLMTIHSNWVDKVTVPELQKTLTDQAKYEIQGLKFNLPGLQEKDIDVTFTRSDLGKGEFINTFAEYKNGQLTIKQSSDQKP
jgi:hypothetical protein